MSWHRRKLAVLAALAAVLTGIAATQPDGPATIEVVRAKRQLPGGWVLGADDLSIERVVAADAPDAAARDPAALVGSTLAAPVARRQVLTPLALTTTRVGLERGHVLAPIRLADADVVSLLRPGDVVDVLVADGQERTAAVVARGVRVVTLPIPAADGRMADAGALMLVEVTTAAAAELARAAAAGTLSVIWR